MTIRILANHTGPSDGEPYGTRVLGMHLLSRSNNRTNNIHCPPLTIITDIEIITAGSSLECGQENLDLDIDRGRQYLHW